MKIAAWVMAALFLYALAVQYNDPDPVLWMLAYGSAAALSVAYAKAPWPAPATLGALALCGSVFLSLRVIGQQHLIDSEEGREMGGLAIVSVWMFVVAIQRRRS